MTTLVLTTRRIEALHSGYDLRVAQLCRRIPGDRHNLVVPLTAPAAPSAPPTIDASALFSTVEERPPLLGTRRRRRRHARLSNDRLVATACPAALLDVRERVRALIDGYGVDRIVVFGGYLAEVAVDLGPDVVLDVCDSDALTRRRALTRVGARHRPHAALGLLRARRTEARLPDRFAYVTTVSAVDTEEILRLHGPADNVVTVPNGVDESYLAPMPAPGTRRGVVFWGNLSFAPNADALAYFVHQVFLPHLRDAGVTLRVIGAAAPTWLVDLAAREPLIELSGFVADLRDAVRPYPVMVNPMRTGSGLKNKVLEAFGLGTVVVSTSRGVEALPAVRGGEHLVLVGADRDGTEFAAAVLDLLDRPERRTRLRENANRLLHEKHTWAVVGRSWDALFAERGVRPAPQPPAGRRRVGVLNLDALTEAEVVERVRGRLRAGRGGRIVTANIDFLRAAGKDAAVASMLGDADLVVADGMPLVWASRLANTALPERVTGSSLIFSLSAAAAAEGRSIFLLGGAATVPERAAAALQARYPGLEVAGTLSPPFGFDRSEQKVQEVLRTVADAAPDLVFVGLGFPKQERLVVRLRETVDRAWLIGCGAAIPMAAGATHRAPVALQRAGLEWAYRLAAEPGRLARRYLVDDAPFAVRLFTVAMVNRLRNR